MYAQVEKSKEYKSRAVANTEANNKSESMQGFGFVDNRPEAIAQRKLQEMANNNPQVKQLSASQKRSSPIQSKKVIQGWFVDEDPATLAIGTPNYNLYEILHTDANVDWVNNYVDGLNRANLQFWVDTQRALLEHSPHRAFHVPIGVNADDVRLEMHWYVEDDNQWMIFDAIEIGHVLDWRAHLKMCGVINLEEAKTAYNDLRNLRLQSTGGNRSHAWEIGPDGAWLE
jgi:hypothetical protein